MKAFFRILISCMFLLSLFSFFPDIASTAFAGGSDSTIKIIQCNIWAQLVLISLFTFCIFFVNRHKYLFSAFIFINWFISGRTIGLFADGRINTGWFYMRTNQYLLCGAERDCEVILPSSAKVSDALFYTIYLENNKFSGSIFIGPFIYNRTVKELKKAI